MPSSGRCYSHLQQAEFEVILQAKNTDSKEVCTRTDLEQQLSSISSRGTALYTAYMDVLFQHFIRTMYAYLVFNPKAQHNWT